MDMRVIYPCSACGDIKRGPSPVTMGIEARERLINNLTILMGQTPKPFSLGVVIMRDWRTSITERRGS